MPRFETVKYNYRRRFGFELEFGRNTNLSEMARAIQSVEGENASTRFINRRTWHCKTDCSCGYEIASRVMRNYHGLRKAERVVKALQDAGIRATRSCGFHVHIEVADLTTQQKDAIKAYWIKSEGFILNTLPEIRKNISWARMVSNSFHPNRRYSSNELNNSYPIARYSSLNINPAGTRGTFEFRIAEGTNEPQVVKNWIRFLIHFVETVKDLPLPENLNWYFPDEIFKLLKLMNDDESDVFYLWSPAITEMRNWLISRVCENASDDLDKEMISQISNILENQTVHQESDDRA